MGLFKDTIQQSGITAALRAQHLTNHMMAQLRHEKPTCTRNSSADHNAMVEE